MAAREVVNPDAFTQQQPYTSFPCALMTSAERAAALLPCRAHVPSALHLTESVVGGGATGPPTRQREGKGCWAMSRFESFVVYRAPSFYLHGLGTRERALVARA